MRLEFKKLFAAVLVICMMLTMLPQQTFAIDMSFLQPANKGSMTNPIYADVLDLKKPSVPFVLRDISSSIKVSDICDTLEDAAQRLREGMVARQTAISVVFPADASFDFDDIWRTALEHTGNPVEGDYLKYQWSGLTWGISYGIVGGIECYNIMYYPEYFTNAQQEAEMDAAVEALLEQLNLWDSSDFEKIRGIYDWICDHVTYDYANLNNSKYILKHSAYAALINQTAVCQGYALLFYRLALELGVEARYISGIGNGGAHGWNIVKIGDLYYNLDATWDASGVELDLPYDYFLRGSANFQDHTRDEEFDTPDFNTAHPTSPTDYGMDMQWPVSGSCGQNVTWSLDETGTLVIRGTGAMDDYYAAYPQWNDYIWHIQSVVIEEGVTSVGAYAFYYCNSLKSVTIKGSTAIGEAAFIYCTRLENISMERVTSIGDLAFGGCVALQQATIPATTVHIGAQAFAACTSLQTITVAAGNTAFCAVDNVLFSKDCTRLLAAAASVGPVYTVPSTVTEIGTYAFAYNTNLESVIIAGQVEVLSDYAFTYCTALREITLPDGLEMIGECAFEGCESLVVVQLHEGVTFIGYNAFADCVSLTEITLPATVSQIGECAFAGCTALEKITFTGGIPDIGENAFYSVFAYAYYPDCDDTWGSELLLDYGGFLQWLSYDAHSYSAVVTPPTCDQQGYTTYTCTGCGYSYKDHYVAASGHSWDDGVVTIEPTETVPGERLYTCLLCDCTKKVTIPVKDHVHTYTDTVTAPTCETQGYTTHVCACGESYVDSYVNANGHSMGDWHETQAPTCTMDGIKIKECANCEFYETGAVASTGHSYTIVITAPTCDTEGYTTHTCHCGEKYVDASVAALGHKFVDYISDGNADCITDGTKTAACSRGCGATETVTDTGSATGHSYTQTVVAPTCVEKGYTVYTCRCGYSYQDNDVDALGHKFTNYVSDGNATCTNDGTKTAVCDNGCGTKDVVADAGSAKGHSYSETITAPTCTAQGYTTYLCHCGHSYTDHFVDATGHTFGEWYVVEEPTEAKDGLKRRDCSNCTHHEQETIVYVAGPDHITSDQFLIDEDTIQKIPANLTVGDFLAGIHEQEYVRVMKNGEAVALDSLIGTGMEVQLVVDGQVIMVLIAIVTGDVNGDGSITVTDMLQIKSQLLNKSKIEGVYALAADTNKDGNISITDFMQVKAHILGKSMITP